MSNQPNMETCFQRVCTWNKLRYDREFNRELLVALLKEEFEEWVDATEDVDRLDGLMDVIYVAMGGLWKLDLTEEQMGQAHEAGYNGCKALADASEDANIGYFIAPYIYGMKNQNSTEDSAGSCFAIIYLAIGQACSMGLTLKQVYEALNIVCDSNASKSVKKTASDVKANGNDKGEFFRPPEPRLRALLEQANAKT